MRTGEISDIAIRAHLNATYGDLNNPDAEHEEYIRLNPKLYETFSEMAFKAIFLGKKVSARCIVETMRWETEVRCNGKFKIDNDCVPYMARKFMKENPQVGNYFETRGQK